MMEYSATREARFISEAWETGLISTEERAKLMDDITPALVRELVQHTHTLPIPKTHRGLFHRMTRPA